MAPDDALGWLRSVNGQLYRNNPHPSGKKAWVAVVRAAGSSRGASTLIIALGSTMEEAAQAAGVRWQRLNAREQRLH